MSWFRRAVPDPKLPPGDIGRSLIGNTFAFHNDAQALILDNIERYPSLPVYRANVIGKNVALVVDYRAAQAVMGSSGEPEEDQPRFSKREAYGDLMAPFFVEPNILLEDSSEFLRPLHRATWDQHMSDLLDGPRWTNHADHVREIAQRYRDEWVKAGQFEVYKGCKAIARELVFQLFLGLDKHDGLWNRAMKLSETSLRGQFSLPLRANLGGIFASTYSRGLQAQSEMRELVKGRIQGGRCPFAPPQADGDVDIPAESLVTHTSMFASSLVVKAIASYLTFCLLQRTRDSEAPLDNLMKETERLCPPIIGTLRRLMDSWILGDLQVPAGWDVWLYFPLINRDPEVYGSDAWQFDPSRWNDPSTPPTMSFGQGDGQCLGVDLVRRIAKEVLDVLGPQIQLDSTLDPSLKDFLGWEKHDGGWQGVKQLPVQRPRAEVILRYSNSNA